MLEFGGCCQRCGTEDALEFAHAESTTLNSKGRGRKERYYDVKRNISAYILLCKPCHKAYDKQKRGGAING
jgi:hypothetical protein